MVCDLESLWAKKPFDPPLVKLIGGGSAEKARKNVRFVAHLQKGGSVDGVVWCEFFQVHMEAPNTDRNIDHHLTCRNPATIYLGTTISLVCLCVCYFCSGEVGPSGAGLKGSMVGQTKGLNGDMCLSDWCDSQGMRVAGSNTISIGGSFPYSLLSTSQLLTDDPVIRGV